MKRIGQLMEAIAAPDNLRLAYWKAARSKRAKQDCQRFREQLDENLEELRRGLLSGQVPVGDYHYFTIHDPKQRLICAASFAERVLHHALMNVCEPVLERAAVYDSYACRKGKGRLLAVERAQGYARQHGWFLKLDIRKYFDSIHHATLCGLLRQKFKDSLLLALFDRILGSYATTPGCGLPIGNLTSQHFANYYLAPLDRFIKEELVRTAYVRYMDDFVIWGRSAFELQEVCVRIQMFVAVELKLELKANKVLNQTRFGMDFLGYRLFPGTVRLARRSKLRFARKFRGYERAYVRGQWSELTLQQRMQALLAFVLPVESGAFRRDVLRRFGVVAIGLEPGDPRGQLEQQCDQLPVGEPQQQQPGGPEQQQRIPVRPAPSSTSTPKGAGADPDTILSCPGSARAGKQQSRPSGASRPAAVQDRNLPAGQFPMSADPKIP